MKISHYPTHPLYPFHQSDIRCLYTSRNYNTSTTMLYTAVQAAQMEKHFN